MFSSVCWTPPASVEGSTPTWTEGTPSFTESSSSEQGTLLVISFVYFREQQSKTVSYDETVKCLKGHSIKL